MTDYVGWIYVMWGKKKKIVDKTFTVEKLRNSELFMSR